MRTGDNATECIIGLNYRIRVKTTRGFENGNNALAHPCLSAFIRGTEVVCHLRKVV